MVPILVILFVLALILIGCCVKIVPQTYVYVIERLGRYYKTCDAGINFIVPFIDRVAGKVTVKETALDFPPQPVITKDNVAVRIDSVVFMKVTDPKLFIYGAQNPIQSVENLSATTLRAIVGALEFDQTLTSRDHINTKMRAELVGRLPVITTLESLDKATDPWGIKITRAEVKNIQPPADILEIMQKQMTAEREKRQAVLEAEGYKQASITHAEGDKQAKILAAEAESEAAIALARGQAESIRIVYEAEAQGINMLAASQLNDDILRLKALQALKDVADGNATKIFFPTDLADVATLGLTGESLDIHGATNATASAPKKPVQQPHIEHPNPVGSSGITERVLVQGHRAQANTAGQMMQRQSQTEI